MKKKLSLILLITIISFFSVSSEVRGLDSTIYAKSGNRIKGNFVINQSTTSMKTITSGGSGYVYCLDHKKTEPNTGVKYSNKKDISNKYPGIAYIIQNGFPNKKTGNDAKDYYVTQMAINWYMDTVDGTSQLGSWFKSCHNCSKTQKNTYNRIKSLVDGAKTYSSSSSSLSVGSITMNENDDKFESNLVNVKGNTGNYSVALTSAPQGVKITDQNGNVKTTFSRGEKFKIVVPKSSISTGETILKVKISTTSDVAKVYSYSPNKSGYQRIAPVVVESGKQTVTKNVSVTNSLAQCDYNNANHFKINGSGTKPNSGPNGENCCEFFSDGNHPNLVKDHPICGICENVLQKTVYDGDSDEDIAIDGITLDKSERCDFDSNTDNNGKQGSVTTFIINDYVENDIESDTCFTSSALIDNNSSMNFIEKEINSYCKIKCLEKDTFNIPEDPYVTVFTYHFVWPTTPTTAGKFGNKYPFNTQSDVTCRIIVDGEKLKSEKTVSEQNIILNKCAQMDGSNLLELNTFNPTIKLIQYYKNKNGVEKSKNLGELVQDDKSTYCTDNLNNDETSCTNTKSVVKFDNSDSIDEKIEKLRDFRFTITKEISFKLNSSLNAFVNRSNSSSSEETSNTVPIGYGNISIDFTSSKSSFTYIENAFVSGKLKLYISNISDHFNNNGNTDLNCDVSYGAKYDAKNAGSIISNKTKYYCGPGTNKPGKDLTECIQRTNKPDECAAEMCFDDTDKHYCSPSTSCVQRGKCIYDDISGINLECCEISTSDWNFKLSEYSGDEELTQKYFDKGLCYDGDDGYNCPVNLQNKSCYPNKDITSCVTEKIKSGISEDDAYNKCVETECCPSGDTTPKIVIVRSIDLDNPFPSITGITDSSDKLGRLPGYNWRTDNESLKKEDQKTVYTVITNNRGVETTQVYSKTPLYTFELNANTIKKIKEYNKNHSYDDFEFNCDSEGKKCISDSQHFVHNPLYGFVDDTSVSSCAGITHDTFLNCRN